MNCGGGPAGSPFDSYVGGALWQNPGAFANGFKGVCTVFVTAAFSFGKLEREEFLITFLSFISLVSVHRALLFIID